MSIFILAKFKSRALVNWLHTVFNSIYCFQQPRVQAEMTIFSSRAHLEDMHLLKYFP